MSITITSCYTSCPIALLFFPFPPFATFFGGLPAPLPTPLTASTLLATLSILVAPLPTGCEANALALKSTLPTPAALLPAPPTSSHLATKKKKKKNKQTETNKNKQTSTLLVTPTPPTMPTPPVLVVPTPTTLPDPL